MSCYQAVANFKYLILYKNSAISGFCTWGWRKRNGLQSITVGQKEQQRQSFKVNLNESGIIPLFYDTAFLIKQNVLSLLLTKKTTLRSRWSIILRWLGLHLPLLPLNLNGGLKCYSVHYIIKALLCVTSLRRHFCLCFFFVNFYNIQFPWLCVIYFMYPKPYILGICNYTCLSRTFRDWIV